MLTVSPPMSVTRATQYFKADDYYLSQKGEWQGRGAEVLGLGGEVKRKDFTAVLRGADPSTGEVLVERKMEDGKEARRGGIDLTFSAPKSVSLLALTDPQVKDAHQRSVSTIVDYLERQYAHTREQHDGTRIVVEQENLAVAKFTHMVARASGEDALPDPQLHTHAFVVNLVRTEEGGWKAHHNDAIYRDQLELGRFYRAELAAELRGLGYAVEVTDSRKFLWEVKGVPEPLISEFSKRREQIVTRAEELRESGQFERAGDAALREIANKTTRLPKTKISPEALFQHWSETTRSYGYTLDAIRETARREGVAGSPDQPAISQKEAIREASRVKTETESVFTRGAVLDLAIRLSPAEHGFGALDGAFGLLARSGELPFLGTTLESGPGGRTVPRHAFTTSEMLSLERDVHSLVSASKGVYAPIGRVPEVTAFVAERSEENGIRYTRGQIEAAVVALTSPDRVNLVQGDAGAGKTASLALVREFAERKGVRVVGLGFTGKAAQELQDGAGIPSRTLDGFLHSRAGEALPSGSFLVLDEASMAGTRHFHRLLSLAEERDHKVLIVGDRKQFQSIAAGRNHAVLQDLTDVDQVHMSEVLRQQTPHARAVVHSIAHGKTDRALRLLSAEGAFRQIGNRELRLNVVVEDYLRLREEKGQALILSATNLDRIALNERIREARVRRGEIQPGTPYRVQEPTGIGAEEAIEARSYKVGDKVLVLRDVSERLKGGSEADVVGTNSRRNAITVRTPGGEEEIRLRAHYDKLAVYSVTERPFSAGDRVVFLRNDTKLGVENGLQGTVRRLDDRGNVVIETERKREVRFRLADPEERQSNDALYRYNFQTHAYAVTEYKSQGATTPAVVWYADAKRGRINRNSFYVAATRAKETIRIVTDDSEALKRLVRNPQSKSSTLDYEHARSVRPFAYWRDPALARSPESPLPSNQHPEDPTKDPIRVEEKGPSPDRAPERIGPGAERGREIERTR